MATGFARGAAQRGKRIAFGDGNRIVWDSHSEQIFRNNPNIALPGHERQDDVEWHPFRKGHRLYNEHDRANDRWTWNLEFRPVAGELYFDDHERQFAGKQGRNFVIIEPNVPSWKHSAANKRWPLARYEEVARRLRKIGCEVVQFGYGKGGDMLANSRKIETRTFRHALAVLANARLFVGPEGGLHHGAAAVGVKGVVLFGGFIPPQVTGYDMHTNLTGGADACGSLRPCRHCWEAMDAISVDDVIAAAEERLAA